MDETRSTDTKTGLRESCGTMSGTRVGREYTVYGIRYTVYGIRFPACLPVDVVCISMRVRARGVLCGSVCLSTGIPVSMCVD
jgi:hypothetical protein